MQPMCHFLTLEYIYVCKSSNSATCFQNRKKKKKCWYAVHKTTIPTLPSLIIGEKTRVTAAHAARLTTGKQKTGFIIWTLV